MSDLASALGLHKSTVHNIVRTLDSHGFLEQDPATKKYKLGHRLVELASARAASTDLRLIARPLLHDLMVATQETVFLVVRDGASLVLIEKEESVQPMKISSPIGRRIPITAGAASRVILSSLDEAARDLLIQSAGLPQYTPKSITDIGTFKERLAQARQQGYATETDEFMEGVCEIAAPVFDARNEPVAAIVVAALTVRMHDGRMPSVIEMTVSCARTLSRHLGNPSSSSR